MFHSEKGRKRGSGKKERREGGGRRKRRESVGGCRGGGGRAEGKGSRGVGRRGREGGGVYILCLCIAGPKPE